jgi:hypothetical protein
MVTSVSLLWLGLAMAAGLLAGVVLAGAVLLEHPFYWTLCIRLPEGLYNNLARAAAGHRCSLKVEVLDRLMDSFEHRRLP